MYVYMYINTYLSQVAATPPWATYLEHAQNVAAPPPSTMHFEGAQKAH